MLRWVILTASLFLILNTCAFGQGCSVDWYYIPENGSPLTTVCQGGTPVPDGYPIWVMWDANSNGPDISDLPADTCDVPPLCEGGPVGTTNYNEFPFNGSSGIGSPGYFLTESSFQTTGALPGPPRFYLRVYEADGVTPLWTSIVYTVVTGPQEFFIPQSDWTCGAGGPQCVVIDEQE